MDRLLRRWCSLLRAQRLRLGASLISLIELESSIPKFSDPYTCSHFINCINGSNLSFWTDMSGPLGADWYIFIYFAPLCHCVSLVLAPFTRFCAWKVLNIADSSRKSFRTKADQGRQANKTKFMTKMANRINKYQSRRWTIWKIASNAWFTTALAILLRPEFSHCRSWRTLTFCRNHFSMYSTI